MPDYSKGKIYTIRSLNDPNIYVGSTIQSLAVRMGGHRLDYAKNKVLGHHKEIVIDINDWKIELHELFPCNTKQELHRREGEVIRQLGTLNKCIAGRTSKEYYADNINKFKEQKNNIVQIMLIKLKKRIKNITQIILTKLKNIVQIILTKLKNIKTNIVQIMLINLKNIINNIMSLTLIKLKNINLKMLTKLKKSINNIK